MARPSPSPSRSPKIMMQYRTRDGRAYEFTSLRNVVSLVISQSGTEQGQRAWHAQAKALGELPSHAVDGWGNSAIAAFQDVAGAWAKSGEALCAFDWEAASQELRLVRAF